MKKLLSILLLLLMAQMSMSQIISVENGISISSLKKDFDKKVYPYQFMVNLEYCDKGWFNLSSGIGKLTKGGELEIPIVSENGTTSSYGNVNLYADYLTLNTMFDFKYTKRYFTFYLGAGPRIDIKLKERVNYSLDEISSYPLGTTNSVMYGANVVAGVRYMINQVQLGLNIGYLCSFNKMYTGWDKKDVFDKTFQLGLSIGYKL